MAEEQGKKKEINIIHIGRDGGFAPPKIHIKTPVRPDLSREDNQKLTEIKLVDPKSSG